MQRIYWMPSYGLVLKSGVGFPVKVGYRIFDPSYTLGADLVHWKV